MKHNRQVNHILSSYFAPRGQNRMYALGMQLAQLYLLPTDKLIGVIAEAGSCKSALLRRMFPGSELTIDAASISVLCRCLTSTRASAFSLPIPTTWISALKTALPR